MLFQSTDDVKTYIPVNTSLSFDVLSPFITIAERDYLKKIIGSALYAEIAAYIGSATVTEAQKLLLDYAKTAVINIALWRWAKKGTLQASDLGLTRQESTNQKTPFKYQEQEFKETYKEDGFNALDLMLEYLEENIDTFPTFKQSVNYTVFKGHLINETREFNAIRDIGASRLVFLRVQRFIVQVEDFHVIPTIGREQYDALMALIAYQGSGSGSGTGVDNVLSWTLIGLLKKAVAHLAVYEGISDLNVNITDKGFFFDSSEGGQNSFDKKTNVTETFNTNETLPSIARNALKAGNGYMNAAREFLVLYADDFPLYADWVGFDDSSESQGMSFDNTDKKTVRM
jgi:hypothetical protein